MRRWALLLVACAVLGGLPCQGWADIIDTFGNTTQLGPPGFAVQRDAANGNEAVALLDLFDAASVLGDTRRFGGVYSVAAATGSTVSLGSSSQVNGGAFLLSNTLTVTGSTASAVQIGLGYGVSGSSQTASADASVPFASVLVQYGASGDFLADFTGQQGIAVDIESLNAAAVGTVLTLAISDTALNAAQLSLIVVGPGAQTVFFPFASLVPTEGEEFLTGVFRDGLAGPVNLSSIGAVALLFEPALNGSFAVGEIRTVAAAAVPAPSGLTLLSLGALGAAAYCGRRARSAWMSARAAMRTR